MTPFVLIDSSAWLFALGSGPVEPVRRRVQDLIQENRAAITSPILFELLSGLKTPREAEALSDYLTALHLYPLTHEDWMAAARWTHGIRRKGSRVKTMDALIAFTAHRHGLTLLHADRDFDRLGRVTDVRMESFVSVVERMTK